MSSREIVVTFNKLKIKPVYGKIIFDIYYVVENNKSKVMQKFWALDIDTKEEIKTLISKMATIEKYKSFKIKYNINQYNYGEIRPMPHRFFFFQKCGNNYIFFHYLLKKENSLSDNIYKGINKLKVKYEEEFKKFIEKSK